MNIKLTLGERLKDLRVERNLKLEALAEQTGLSKSALSKYESDDVTDLSIYAVTTLAEFYGVTTDYLLGVTENKKRPDAVLLDLHLSDGAVDVLRNGKFNHRLLCELIVHENFRRFMTDLEIYVDGYVSANIQNLNAGLEATRQMLKKKYAADENDLYMSTLKLGQIDEDTLTRESSIRYYQRAIDTAQFLECPAIQISTGFGYFDMPREEAWKFCRESVGTLAAYAERKGVTLLLEELKVTTTNVLITSKDLAKMIAEIDSPAVVGMVDMDQMTYAGETIDDYFANLGDKLQHIHFNDRGHTVPGDADFPMKEYYDQIKAHGYEGTCSFEICDRRYYIDPDKAIDDTVAWMRANTHELD